MKIDDDNIYQRLVELGDDWSEKRYAAELLAENRKPLIARLAASSECKDGSQGAKESWAMRHPDYQEHVQKTADANRAEAKARVRYNSAFAWLDYKRSVMATERASNKHAT